MNGFEVESASGYVVFAGTVVSGVVFFPWRCFGTGYGCPNACFCRRRTGTLFAPFCYVGGDGFAASCFVCTGVVFPISAVGVFIGLCFRRIGFAAVYSGCLWLFSLFFRQLFCGSFRQRRNFDSFGGFRDPVCGDAAVLFRPSGAVLEDICGIGPLCFGKGTPHSACDLRTRLLASAGCVRRNFAGRDVPGPVCCPLVFGFRAGACSCVI